MNTNGIEYKSYFRNESVTLIEVLKNRESAWYFCTGDELSPFHCSQEIVENVNGNDINVRTFEEGELRFDDYFGKLVISGRDSELVINSQTIEIPTDLKDKVERILH
ncbi:hypothetical protein [Bacteriovorax sp. DB6_IX]|uniref:hypothetical protein n=1 Tax=Bacteriovorax sp. DB6_IX TaxID=1353530 RepID=UPI00038A45BC|nr:hypothetical protein [Bacteriovorax sp. DB6_IX]EQC43095.1 hypothetical protein M901_2226 [Bacteriovorax sp. DB6_IX]